MRLHAILLIGSSVALLPACSDDGATDTTPSGPKTTVTQTVGPEGGTIELDGATVTFPSGALAASTSITIAATDEAPPSGYKAVSRIYKCEPSGLSFDPSVTMAMKFQDDGTKATMFWSSGSDPSFKDVGGTISGDVMSAGVAHFSRGFVGHNP